MKSVDRREFIKGSISAAAGLAVLPKRRACGANEKVVLGIMGLGGRGVYLTKRLVNRPDVEIAYLCDVNTRNFARAREEVEEVQDRRPKLLQDFRRMLDDSSVDAIVNATPDHWHCLGTIMACQAGKDVYVEKPLSQNIWEGRKAVEAARKYKRVVQVGTQSRSSKELTSAIEYIRAGKLGDIHVVRVFHILDVSSGASTGSVTGVPEGLDYKMWCGPAPEVPYRTGRWWPNLWDFSAGRIAEDAAHQMDLARALIDKSYPDTVYHAGGIDFAQDSREIPDTQLITCEYGAKLRLMIQGALWAPYMKKTPWNMRDGDQFPDWRFNSTKIELLGTGGFMVFGRHGGGWQAYDKAGEVVQSEYGRHAIDEHLANFIDCIRTRNKPNADVEQGHLSVLPFHLANISYRVGSRKLEFDAETESIKNITEANEFLRREDRHPWVIPEQL